MKPGLSAETMASDEMMAQSQRKADVTTEPLEHMRLLCLSRGASGLLELGRVFRRMDHDGNRNLSKDEFSKGIQDAGVTITKDEVDKLFKAFDTDNSGSISIDEFLLKMRPPMNESRQKSAEMAFNKLDKNGDGYVTLEDLRSVYNVKSNAMYQSGEESEDQRLSQFMANFEQGVVDGVVTKEEFMNYYAGISASIDTDVFFDLMIRQCYKL